MIRDLTEDKTSRLLCQEDVDRLPVGTEVYIKWSGGNGPWLYKIVDQLGMTYVSRPKDGVSYTLLRLGCVERERYSNQVFLKEKFPLVIKSRYQEEKGKFCVVCNNMEEFSGTLEKIVGLGSMNFRVEFVIGEVEYNALT